MPQIYSIIRTAISWLCNGTNVVSGNFASAKTMALSTTYQEAVQTACCHTSTWWTSQPACRLLQLRVAAEEKSEAAARAESALGQAEAQIAALAESQGRIAQQCDALTYELQQARHERAQISQESEVSGSWPIDLHDVPEHLLELAALVTEDGVCVSLFV